MPSLFKTILAISIAVISHSNLLAQATIQSQFDDFYQNQTSTWNGYKMIKMPGLQEFLAVVSDTIKIKNDKIVSGQLEIAGLNDQINVLNTELEETNVALVESNALNETIGFMGMQLSKWSYSAIVWIIIASLIVGIAALYLMYLRNHSITKEAKALSANIESEFNDYKEQARERQTKLKRDLQTALNALHENRIKL
jgi:hypothetical protein